MLINTCGVCLQYHNAIYSWWPIPIHHGCRCRQTLIKPAAEAPPPFIDYRELLDAMPPAEQAAAISEQLPAAQSRRCEVGRHRHAIVRLRPARGRCKRKSSPSTRCAKPASGASKPRKPTPWSTPPNTSSLRNVICYQIMRAWSCRPIARGDRRRAVELASARRVTIAEGPTGPYTEGQAWGAWADRGRRFRCRGLTIDGRTVTVRPGESRGRAVVFGVAAYCRAEGQLQMSNLPETTTPVYATDEDIAVCAGGDFITLARPGSKWRSAPTAISRRTTPGFSTRRP